MATVPDIANTDRVISYTATPGQTDFAVPWPVIAQSLDEAAADLKINVNSVPVDVGLVSFVGNVITGLDGIWGGGIVTIPACAGGERVVVYSNRAPRRTGNFLEGRSLPFTSLDQLLDDLVIQLRDLQLSDKRALKLSIENYLDGVTDPSDVVDEVAASAAAAAASAASAAAAEASVASQITIITNYGKYKGVNNIFDLINDASYIGHIQTRNFVGPYMDTYWAAMNAAGGTWLFPAGDYHLNAKQAMAAGVQIWGAGNDVASGTQIFVGGDGSWGLEQINPNGVTSYEAFKLKDIYFQLTNGGIRWNDTAAGIDDTSGTMSYMVRPRVERCTFNNDSGSHFYGLNLNKAFNGYVRDCTFIGNSVAIYLRGSDLNSIRDNRFDGQTDGCILDISVGTFGSTNDIHHNDLNNPKNYFYRGNNRNALFYRNHCELDSSPGSTGSGGNMEAAIDIIDGNGFRTTIHDNDMSVDVFADRWLRFRSTTIYTLDVRNNGTPSSVLPQADIGNVAYFTSSGNRVIVRHDGNQGSDIYFPMNSKAGYGDESVGQSAAVLGPSYPGVAYATGIGWDQAHQPSIYLKCNSGDFVLPADAASNHYIEFSDWSGYPANSLTGTFTVYIVSAAAVNGQVMNWQLLDGASVISSGTITHGTANQMFGNAICTSQGFNTKFVLRVWNQDTTRNNVVYFHLADVRVY